MRNVLWQARSDDEILHAHYTGKSLNTGMSIEKAFRLSKASLMNSYSSLILH